MGGERMWWIFCFMPLNKKGVIRDIAAFFEKDLNFFLMA